MLKMGIIGLGKMGVFHIGWMTPENGLQFVAGCEKNPKRVEELKQKYDANFYTDVDEFLAKEKDLDFVVIVTTHDTHEDLTIKCLNAGKNVIVEKPMTMTYDSAERMIAAARKNKKHLFVHQSSRWDREFLLLKEVIESGKIGKVLQIESKATFCDAGWPEWGIEGAKNPWRVKAKFGGGMLYDWGPHLVDQIAVLMGREPKGVFGVLQSGVWSKEVDDYFFALLDYDDVVCQIECSNNTRIPAPRWQVVGTKGMFYVPGKKEPFWGDVEISYMKDNGEQIVEKVELVDVKESGIEGGFYRDLNPYLNGEIDHFVRMEEAGNVVKVLEMIKKSSQEKRYIPFE
jgi:scyllo-inositol 2-dehydrogenase (NADP+)